MYIFFKRSITVARKKAESENNAENNARKKVLDSCIDEIGKRFGEESIMCLGMNYVAACDAISTGSLSLDLAIGVGGVPRGRIIEFFGPESSGKTTLALHVVANAQKNGGIAAFIDAEHALDPSYARKLGVNLESLLVSQPDSGEQALEIAEMLTRSGAVDVIVVDSVAALTPQAELDGDMGQAHVGLQARLMSQALRKLTAVVKKTNTIIIFINQVRMKIGVSYGSPETTPGGKALKFYASVRLDIRRIGSVKKGEDVTGSQTKVKVVKNKVAPPFRVASFDILFSKGISADGELIDLAVAAKILQKSGTWLSYGEERLGQGRERAIEFLQQNQDIRKEIDGKVRAILMSGDAELPVGTDGDDSAADE